MATVLVVDDYADACEVLARTLQMLGHTADVAMDGAAALAYVRAMPPALVFLDVMMPGLNGYEILAAMRADPATAGVPVVMYTAHGTDGGPAAAARLGAQGYLVKGAATVAELADAVERLAGGSPG